MSNAGAQAPADVYTVICSTCFYDTFGLLEQMNVSNKQTRSDNSVRWGSILLTIYELTPHSEDFCVAYTARVHVVEQYHNFNRG